MDYLGLIQTKYNLTTLLDAAGMSLVALASDEQGQLYFERWDIPYPQPSVAEIEAYAASPEYRAARGAQLKIEATARVNAWANQKVMQFGILIDELFYTAMIANIGFLSTKWVRYGRPAELDPFEFVCIHSEAQAYRDSHAGKGDPPSQLSAFQLAQMQESRWQDMQNGFAPIVYVRRFALETILLAAVDENLQAGLDSLIAGLDPMLMQTIAGLQQQQAALLAQQGEV